MQRSWLCPLVFASWHLREALFPSLYVPLRGYQLLLPFYATSSILCVLSSPVVLVALAPLVVAVDVLPNVMLTS
jgi:hypothetical protein